MDREARFGQPNRFVGVRVDAESSSFVCALIVVAPQLSDSDPHGNCDVGDLRVDLDQPRDGLGVVVGLDQARPWARIEINARQVEIAV
jgi:hypothetical protein